MSGIVSGVLEDINKVGIEEWVRNFGRKQRPTPIGGISNKEFKAYNMIALQDAADKKGFNDPRWFSQAEASKVGASLKDGELPTKVSVPTIDHYVDENGKEHEFVSFKEIELFNAEQFDGVSAYNAEDRVSYTPEEAFQLVASRFNEAEIARGRSGLMSVVGRQLTPGEQSPNYSMKSGQEVVTLPLRSQFDSDEAWLQSLFHELAHSTGKSDRNGRVEFARGGKDDSARAREEVIAEMASTILMNKLGLDWDSDNSARYMAKHANMEGLSDAELADLSVKAEAAVDFILGNDVLPEWNPSNSKNFMTEAQFRNTSVTPLNSSYNYDTSEAAIEALGALEDVSLDQNATSGSKDAVEKVIGALRDKLETVGFGNAPWRKPYKDGFEYVGGSGMPRNPASKHIYSGTNSFVLSISQRLGGYQDSRWMTYKQAQDLGGQVRKGEKGTAILFPKMYKFDKNKDGSPILDANGEPTTRSFIQFGVATVFNVEQIDGLDLKDDVPTTSMAPLDAQNFVLERYIKNLEAKGLKAPDIQYTYVGQYGNHFLGDTSPNWSPTSDIVTLPQESQFNSPEEWFETLMHELAHSTGHKSRLDRSEITDQYATSNSARGLEELIAELASAALAEMFGVNYDRSNVSSYLESWQKAISQTDFSSFQQASALAQQAVDYLLGMDLGDWSPIEGYKISSGSRATTGKEGQ